MKTIEPNGINLDEIEALLRDHNAQGVSRALALDLVARIRELEAQQKTAQDKEDAIWAWQDMNIGRTVHIAADHELWQWRWGIAEHYERRSDYGRAATVTEAIDALYQSLVDAGEIRP